MLKEKLNKQIQALYSAAKKARGKVFKGYVYEIARLEDLRDGGRG